MKNPMVQKGPPEKPSSSTARTASIRRSRWDSSDPKGTISGDIARRRNGNEESKFSAGKASNDVYNGRFDARGGVHPVLPAAGDSPFRLRDDFTAPPPYGFQDLERRTIALADGTFRSYFALPPDPQMNSDRSFPFGARDIPRTDSDGVLGRAPEEVREFPPFSRDHWSSHGPRDSPERPSSAKREYGNSNAHRIGFKRGSRSPRRDERDEIRLPKQAKLADSNENSSRRRRGDTDSINAATDMNPEAMKRAFLRFSRMIYENPSLKNNLLEDGKKESLSCLACGRASKSFRDIHALVMHTFHSQNIDLRVDHLGLHKALCVFMGWNYEKAPETSKAYQLLPSDTAIRNREDLVVWPPILIIHRKDGHFEGIGSKEIDNKLKDLGISGRRWRPISLDTVAVRFPADNDGFREAERAAEKLEREGRGRRAWARGPKDAAAVYGYLAVAADLEQLDEEGKKRALLRSRRDLLSL